MSIGDYSAVEIEELERHRIDYVRFLERKAQDTNFTGFEPAYLPDCLFDFQRSIVDWNIRKGKSATLIDCGMGKSLIELVWGENVVRHTNKPVLDLTPLAVAPQTVNEAAKFDIPIYRCNDGKPVGKCVQVTNYEKLHKFNAADYGGVICDECFPGDTEVDVPNVDKSLGKMYIKDVHRGDVILNAAGEDYVDAIAKRRIERAIRISTAYGTFTCSDNHPWFTVYGWRRAEDLQPGNLLVGTATAMRLVRGNHISEECGAGVEEILQSILLSEMAHEPARDQGQGTQSRGPQESDCWDSQVVEVGNFGSGDPARAHSEVKPNSRPGSMQEDIGYLAADRMGAGNTRRERKAAAGATTHPAISARVKLDAGVSGASWAEGPWISDSLQGRLSATCAEDGDRGGWQQPLCSQGGGSQEGREADFVRVDSVEVLEPGHPDLERYREADGHVYFL